MASSAGPSGADDNVTSANDVDDGIDLYPPGPRGQARDLPNTIQPIALQEIRILQETDTNFEEWVGAVNRSLGPLGLRRLTNAKLPRPLRGEPEYKRWFYYSQTVAAWLISHVSEPMQQRLYVSLMAAARDTLDSDDVPEYSEEEDIEYEPSEDKNENEDEDEDEDEDETDEDETDDDEDDDEDSFADDVMTGIASIMRDVNSTDQISLDVCKFSRLSRNQFRTVKDFIVAVQSQYTLLRKNRVAPPPFYVLCLVFEQLPDLPIVDFLRYEISSLAPDNVTMEVFYSFCRRMQLDSMRRNCNPREEEN